MLVDKAGELFQSIFNDIENICFENNFKNDDWKKYETTTMEHIVIGLAMKSNKHCQAAEKLEKLGFIEEATILLRCAYETTLLMDYLYLYPEEKDNYLCWSDSVSYKNYLCWPTFLEVDEKFTEILNNTKISIQEEIRDTDSVNNKYLKDLESTDIPTSFMKLHVLVQKRNEKSAEKNQNTDFLGNPQVKYHTYRAASSLVHPNWNLILKHYLRVNKEKEILEFSPNLFFAILLTISEQNLYNIVLSELINQDTITSIGEKVFNLRTLFKLPTN